MENENNLIISAAPHLKSDSSTSKIMWTVVFCLIPAGIWGVYSFGFRSLFIILNTIGAAVLTEFIINKVLKKENSKKELVENEI